MPKNMYIISIEGCDGVGKSTLIDLLSNHYKNFANICFVKNATNKKLDEKVVLYRNSRKHDPFIHMYLEFLSTHITLIDTLDSMKNIPENMERVIVFDRYWYSLLAYTNILSGQNVDDTIMKFLPKPDLVVYLNCKPENSYFRKYEFEAIESGCKTGNHFANYCDFQKKIHYEYRRLLNKYDQKKIELMTDELPLQCLLLKVIEKIDERSKQNE